MKRKYMIINVVIIVIVAFLCFGGYYNYTYKQEEVPGFSNLYRYMSSLTPIDFTKELSRNRSFCVYFGSPECPDCHNFEDTLIEILQEEDIVKDIYYVNLYWLRKDNSTGYDEIKDKLGFSQIPNFYYFNDGMISSYIEWSEKGLEKSDVLQWMEEHQIISM